MQQGNRVSSEFFVEFRTLKGNSIGVALACFPFPCYISFSDDEAVGRPSHRWLERVSVS